MRAEEEERARREEEEEMARSALESANPDLVRWDDNEDDRDVCGTVPIRERYAFTIVCGYLILLRWIVTISDSHSISMNSCGCFV